MHIAQIVSGRGVNAAIIHCHDLCKQLVARGHRVSLVCRPESWIAEQLADENVDILQSTLDRWPSEINRVGRWLREHKVDVIHTHMSSAHFFGVLLKLTNRIKCVATAHTRKFQPHWMLNDRVIAVSDATNEYHRRVNWVSARRISTVRNFIDLAKYSRAQPGARERLRRELGFEDHHVVIGCVGEVNTRKGVRYLVEAFPKILDACNDARLLIIGEATSTYAKHARDELAEQLGVADKIVWTGHRSDVPDLLRAMDIYTLPSLEETLGLSIIEAMCAKLPAVATTAGGMPEVVVDGTTGILVEPKDVPALADAIGRLANAPDLCRTMGSAGYDYAHECFSSETQMPKIERVLQQTVTRRTAA
ncbi:MAG: glycosyltransferase family 4 protein [Pirellulales bacterium]|nr:glycosyltransferase family 4 protein [Pirellulales bacterium]